MRFGDEARLKLPAAADGFYWIRDWWKLMTSLDRLDPDSAARPGGDPERARELDGSRFHSILFERSVDGRDGESASEPECFPDLNLDQVVEALVAGREEYELEPFFYRPLREVEAVRYRLEVFRDLEQSAVREPVVVFAEQMRTMREHLAQAEKLHYRYEQDAWFLDAVEIYCGAVGSLAAGLGACEVRSRGLQAFRNYLSAYTASDSFTSLAAETRALKEALDGVRYAIRIRGSRVTAGRYTGEADYSAQVEETFARFKQGAVKDYRVDFPSSPGMNHVEARILDCVARLHPDVFGALREYRTRRRDFLDGTVSTFDREVQFYLSWLEHVRQLTSAGLPFCYPRVSARSKDVSARESFDLALASKLVPEGTEVVCNDFRLAGPERIVVVTGPNNGGKTTFARMFGQLHYLAGLGLPVPGREARLFLPDRVFTHFEREEDIETLRGKLDDELVRVCRILEQATSDSVVVMNESFTSTTLNDALFLGTEVLKRIVELGPLGVYVTFVDELASLGEETVSMVSTVVPDNPAVRTYRILRKRADGLAYAWAIAEKYGLTYQALKERVVG